MSSDQSSGHDLIERVQRLLADSKAKGQAVQRRTVARQLNVSEHRTRTLLQLAGPPTSAATHVWSLGSIPAVRARGGQPCSPRDKTAVSHRHLTLTDSFFLTACAGMWPLASGGGLWVPNWSSMTLTCGVAGQGCRA